MKSMANTAAMTPMRIGMPVRGAVVRRHQRVGGGARAVLGRRGERPRLRVPRLGDLEGEPSSASVSKPAASRPTAAATSASPSSTASAAARASRPQGAAARRRRAPRRAAASSSRRSSRPRRQRRAGRRARGRRRGGHAQHGGLELREPLAARRHRRDDRDAERRARHLGVRRDARGAAPRRRGSGRRRRGSPGRAAAATR